MGRLSSSKRQEILERDGGRCVDVNCGETDDLEVDHIVPTYMGGSDDSENLQTLCSGCHDEKTSEDAANPENNAELVRRIRNGRGW